MDTYNAIVYSSKSADPAWTIDQVPATFALRYDLNYEDGGKVVLIYEGTPPEREVQQLMMQVQMAAGRYRFTITRTDASGATIDIPPIPLRH